MKYTDRLITREEIDEFVGPVHYFRGKKGDDDPFAWVEEHNHHMEAVSRAQEECYALLFKGGILSQPGLITPNELIYLLNMIYRAHVINGIPVMYHKSKEIWDKNGYHVDVDENETWQDPNDEAELFRKVIEYINTLKSNPKD